MSHCKIKFLDKWLQKCMVDEDSQSYCDFWCECYPDDEYSVYYCMLC